MSKRELAAGARLLGCLLAAGCAVDDRTAEVVGSGASEGVTAVPSSAGPWTAPEAVSGGGAPASTAPSAPAPLGGAGVEGLAGGGESSTGGAPPASAAPAQNGGAPPEMAAAGDAGEPPGAPQPPVPAALCDQQLLVNGDFDAGRGGWVDTWDVRETLLDAGDPRLAGTGVTPESGTSLAWVGGVASGEYGEKYTSRISQTVTLPVDAVTLRMSGYVWVQQPELDHPTPDWVVLELLANSTMEGYEGWQIAIWSGTDVSSGWVPFEAVNTTTVTQLRGRPLELVADSRPDGNGTLSVWLDSLVLEARCE